MTKLKLLGATIAILVLGLVGRIDADSKEVEAKMATERPEPIFFDPDFDPSKPRRPAECDRAGRQFICERGPWQEWSCLCVDFRRE